MVGIWGELPLRLLPPAQFCDTAHHCHHHSGVQAEGFFSTTPCSPALPPRVHLQVSAGVTERLGPVLQAQLLFSRAKAKFVKPAGPLPVLMLPLSPRSARAVAHAAAPQGRQLPPCSAARAHPADKPLCKPQGSLQNR